MVYKNDPLVEWLNKKEMSSFFALAFVGGVITGIIVASFLHKYIVHALGW